MIDAEIQSYLDKRFAKLEKRLTDVEDEVFQLAQDVLAPEMKPLAGMEVIIDPPAEPKPKPAEWSNHEEVPVQRWTRLAEDKLRNRLGIQWPTYLLVQDGVVKDPVRMQEIKEDDAKTGSHLYDELMAGVQSDHAPQNPT